MKQQASNYLEHLDYSWTPDSIRLIHTTSPGVKQTFFYIQEAGYFQTFPPYFAERADLNSFLIVYTLRGEGRLSYRGKTYRVLPKTVFFIHCMDHHKYECAPGMEWEFLWIHFNGPTSMGYFQEFLKNGFQLLNLPEDNPLEDALRSILSLVKEKKRHSEIQISNLITQILSELLIQNSKDSPELGVTPSYIQTVLKEIDAFFQQPLSLDLLSRNAGVSKYHLCRSFRKYTGTTPNEYLILCRLRHAKELLRSSDASVEEIAYTCGFHHPGHFINLFKRHEETTPLQYRKEWGNG